ncbi:MAG: hypothetical protein R3D98_11290 [Candidatus Krumholzibacteriia bacterium]
MDRIANWPLPLDIPAAARRFALLQAPGALLWHILFVNLMVGGTPSTVAFRSRPPAPMTPARAVAGTVTVNASLAVVLGGARC